MDDTLEYHIKELSRSREEYNSLFEKFKRSKQLFDEREFLNKQKILALHSEKHILVSKVSELKKVINSQKLSSIVCEKKIEKLEHTVEILEGNNFDHERKYHLLADTNKSMKHALMELESNNDHLTQTIALLENKITEDTVPLSEYKQTMHDHEMLELHVLKEMVPLELYQSLEKISDDLKHTIEEKMINKDLYEDLSNSFAEYQREMETQMKDKRREIETIIKESQGDLNALMTANKQEVDQKMAAMVPRSLLEDKTHAFQVMLNDYNASQSEVKTLQELLSNVQNEKAELLEVLADRDGRIGALKGRIFECESEISSLRRNEEEKLEIIDSLRQEIVDCEANQVDLNGRILNLESSKASLLTQLGNAKQKNRKDADIFASSQAELKKANENAIEEISARLKAQGVDLNARLKSQKVEFNAHLTSQCTDFNAKLEMQKDLNLKLQEQNRETVKQLEARLHQSIRHNEELREAYQALEEKHSSLEVSQQAIRKTSELALVNKISELETVNGEYYSQLLESQKVHDRLTLDLNVQTQRIEHLLLENKSLKASTIETSAKLRYFQAQMDDISAAIIAADLQGSNVSFHSHQRSMNHVDNFNGSVSLIPTNFTQSPFFDGQNHNQFNMTSTFQTSQDIEEATEMKSADILNPVE